MISGYPQEFKNTGTSGFVFLEIPVTARHAGLGETSIGLTDLGSQSVFSNPAGLGWNRETHSLSVSYAPWFVEMKHLATSYCYKSDFGVFGFGVNFFDFGTMTKTIRILDQRVFQTAGTFSANALGISLAYAKPLTEAFSFGVAMKYVKETVDIYYADNLLFDGGVIFKLMPRLRIAATLQNFGVLARYRSESFKMPSLLRLGLSGELYDDQEEGWKVTGNFEALHPNDNDEHVHLGTEITYQNMFVLRGGYKFQYDEDSFTLGIG
jgi:hypothetical protein